MNPSPPAKATIVAMATVFKEEEKEKNGSSFLSSFYLFKSFS